MSALPDAPPPYGTVVFDCDSTLSRLEGVEALAGRNPELERLTREAMEGRVALEDVYGRRLALVRPTRDAVARVGRLYVERMVPNADRLCSALRFLGKRVWIVSGGLLPAVTTLASHLGIPARFTAAVDLQFDASGAYQGFDELSPLARSRGKVDIVQGIRMRPGAGPVALVGDGATDLEAAPLCARFIAYAGVERRDGVLAAARVTCTAPDLAALVPLLLAPDEIARLEAHADHAALVRAAQAWL